jgi:16S rRNA A1518/A1519 N6-dimethyltransferase RsmA/KsgA/DIM1 with predicted DNA glycosylase/AP lyase activity|tara:strand:+ start:1397 stop:1654 length:258 start_codon:yes stop_codon:yes gene_type:complete
MARPTTQELLEKQKEIAEKFNAQQIEQDKLKQEFDKITAVIADRQAGEAEIAANVAAETCPAPEVAPASVDPAPEIDAVTVERGT